MDYKKLFTKLTNIEVKTTKKITTGFSNINYLINNRYIFRIPSNQNDKTLNFKNESVIINKIKELNISENVLIYDVNNGYKVSQYIDKSNHYKYSPSLDQIKTFSEILKKFHASKIKVANDYNYFEKLHEYKSNLENDSLISNLIEEKILKDFSGELSKDELILCHNDLVKGNILFVSNKAYLIDWEYASMNSLYFDLASFISENNLSKIKENYFLSCYFKRKLTNEEYLKIEVYKSAQDLLFYYWALHFYKLKGNQIYRKIALNKLDRLKKKFNF